MIVAGVFQGKLLLMFSMLAAAEVQVLAAVPAVVLSSPAAVPAVVRQKVPAAVLSRRVAVPAANLLQVAVEAQLFSGGG